MPIGESVAIKPDWEYVRNVGVDFVLATDEQLTPTVIDTLKTLGASARAEWYALPNGVFAIPIVATGGSSGVQSSSSSASDVFRVTSSTSQIDAAELTNLALGARARMSDGLDAHAVVDGNIDGDFAKGSVVHSGNDPDAWVEVDLGATEVIDELHLWNRTDAAVERLRNYWIEVSNAPMSDSSINSVRGVSDQVVWRRAGSIPRPVAIFKPAGVSGRYVRVRFDPQDKNDRFMHFAELQVFRYSEQQRTALSAARSPSVSSEVFDFDFSRAIRYSFSVDAPARVEYLFWWNPDLRLKVNGVMVSPAVSRGLASFLVKPGKNVIEITYENQLLKGFALLFSFFAIFVFACFAWRLVAGLKDRILADGRAVNR
jgi:hypothetical protein